MQVIENNVVSLLTFIFNDKICLKKVIHKDDNVIVSFSICFGDIVSLQQCYSITHYVVHTGP